jgi:hypothetical protein
MQIEDVRRVLAIGSGTMGLQIGLQAATHGYEYGMGWRDHLAKRGTPRPEIGRIAERRPRQTTLKARMAYGAAWHPRAHISGAWHRPYLEGMARSHRFVPPPIPPPMTREGTRRLGATTAGS